MDGGDENTLRLYAYNDCLKRAKYACECVAFLHSGEYLEATGERLLPEVVQAQFGHNCAALYIITGAHRGKAGYVAQGQDYTIGVSQAA